MLLHIVSANLDDGFYVRKVFADLHNAKQFCVDYSNSCGWFKSIIAKVDDPVGEFVYVVSRNDGQETTINDLFTTEEAAKRYCDLNNTGDDEDDWEYEYEQMRVE